MKKFIPLLLLLSSCVAMPGTYGKNPGSQACPQPFWANESVVAQFRRYPPGSEMREFYNMYVKQQKALEDCADFGTKSALWG